MPKTLVVIDVAPDDISHGLDPSVRVLAENTAREPILHLRKQDKDERDEQESLVDLYLRAMESAGSSQARAA